jgi:hypothetical protein
MAETHMPATDLVLGPLTKQVRAAILRDRIRGTKGFDTMVR